MSNYGDIPYINTDFVTYSIGCVGANHTNFFSGIVPIVIKAVGIWGKKFNFTLMQAEDF